MRKTELLAPAGSYDSLVAAVNAGADAVYIGGSRFGARAYAENPEEELLLKGIDYAHLHGRKLYLTVNTLMKEQDLEEELETYLWPYVERGLDAAIVQDLGALKLLREAFPNLELHASTQMTVTGPEETALLKNMGVSRVVTARELSLREIRRIYDTCPIEIESFVHGALCYCYSGQCLFSSLAGGRSGNRGRCAQPCRLPYRTADRKQGELCLLSMKDLNTLELLPEILEAGVFSLKIEGRMKRPEYTAGVVSVYRKYLDLLEREGKEAYRVEEKDQKFLYDLFHRRGYTDGYYRRQNGREMISLKEPDKQEGQNELYGELQRKYLETPLKEPARGRLVLSPGQPARLEACACGQAAAAEGGTVQRAEKQPLAEATAKRQMEKTGNEEFFWENLEIRIDGDPFLPVGQLNELRRSCLAALKEKILEAAGPGRERRAASHAAAVQASWNAKTRWSASVETKEQLEAVLESGLISRVYLDSMICEADKFSEMVRRVKHSGKECWLRTPQIFRDKAREYFDRTLDSYRSAGLDGILASSAEAGEYFRRNKTAPRLTADHMVYAWNQRSRQALREWGYEEDTLPAELNEKELERRGAAGSEAVVYGRFPMMAAANCLEKTLRGCGKKPRVLRLRDRAGREFPVKNHCRYCYNTIYNTAPLYLLDQAGKLKAMGCSGLRLSFTVENGTEVRKVLALAEAAEAGRPAAFEGEYTRGHWKRKVE